MKPEQYKWKDGAIMKLYIEKATDVQIQIFGGNSRSNASRSVLYNNATAWAGQVVTIDASMEAIILVKPREYVLNGASFSFKYGVGGN